MKIINNVSKDIDDIALAIKSFSGEKPAWGSINPLGEYEPSANGSLWIMLYHEVSSINVIYEDCVPSKFLEMKPESFESEEGIISTVAVKIKKGFSGYIWLLKVSYLIDDKTYPLGFLAAHEQSSLWLKLHEVLEYDTRMLVSAETAIACIDS